MKNLLYILCLFSFHFAFAQSDLPEGFGDYRTIENAEPGKSYTQAYIPPTFKKIVWRDSVLLLENNRHLLTNLTEGKDYEIITEIVETRPAYTIWEFEVPKIDTIIETKTIIVDRICEEIEPMPKFEGQVIIERIKLRDSSFIFIPRLTTDIIRECVWSDLLKDNNIQILTYAMIEVPTRYASIQKKVFQKNEKWWTETIADTFNIVKSRFWKTSVENSAQQIPAFIDTFHIISIFENVLFQSTRPNFSTIQTEVIDKHGYITKWKTVICSFSHNSTVIKKIQEALVRKGYEVPIDNIFGEETKTAIFEFQKANDLPIGNLDKETLKILGVY